MIYKVIEAFADSQDGYYVYHRGDTYPRAGYNPTPERVKALSCTANALNRIIIEIIKTDEKPDTTVETKAVEEKPKTRRKTIK